MEVDITQVRSLRDGEMLVKCRTKKETEKMRTIAEQNMRRQYQVNLAERRNTCLKILDMDEGYTEDVLIEYMKNQNAFLRIDDTYIKVIVIKKMKSKFMATIECDPVTHRRILEEGILSINWTSNCRMFDYVRVYRCFKCGGYNNKSSSTTAPSYGPTLPTLGEMTKTAALQSRYQLSRLREPSLLEAISLYLAYLHNQPADVCIASTTSASVRLRLATEGSSSGREELLKLYKEFYKAYDLPVKDA
nr:unnamed protein product [Callosobruchus analis]